MSNRWRNGGAWNWSLGCVVVGVAAIGLAGCGSGSSSPTPTTHSSTTTSMPGGATTTTATTSGTGTGTAVVNAWESAQQTLYGYLQAPWQQDRANLVAGETAATLWPNLANYFANPALHSEQTFLVGVKMGQLNGPTSFDLGTRRCRLSRQQRPQWPAASTTPGPQRLLAHPARRRWRRRLATASGTWDLRLDLLERGRSPRSRPRRCPSAERRGLASRARLVVALLALDDRS